MDYKILKGIDYAGKRAEPGTVVSDIPSKSIPWLLEQGIIEATDKKQPKREPVSDDKGDE